MTRTDFAIDDVAVCPQRPATISLLAPELLAISRLVRRELGRRRFGPLSHLSHTHAGVRLSEVGLLHRDLRWSLADEVAGRLGHCG